MSNSISIYYNSDGPDLKNLISRLSKRRDLPYYRRTESKIAAMLLEEKLEELLDEGDGGGNDHA